MGGFFFWSEKRLAKYPLMLLGIFQEKSSVACLLMAFLHDFVSYPFFIPLNFTVNTIASYRSA
jgi:hypothetical protein